MAQNLTIYIPKRILKTPLYDSYWYYAYERQNAFFYRNILNQSFPWTKDPILNSFRFTNDYRANDRVSQYLINHVIYGNDDMDFTDEDMVFRIILFKIFNKITTWCMIESQLKEIRLRKNILTDIRKILMKSYQRKEKIYSGAYIMPSGSSIFGNKIKFLNHLALLELMVKEDFFKKVSESQDFEELYHLLLDYPMIGPFLAYQYAIDINYSTVVDFSEDEFVSAGPGAQSGIIKCFSNVENSDYEYIIKYVTEKQEYEFDRLGLKFYTLKGRPLQLIDCQNIFCEFDKYSRVKYPAFEGKYNRTRIKRKYVENHTPINFAYPPKWKLHGKWGDSYE